MMMGFDTSSYIVTKYMLVVEIMTKASHFNPSNVYRWLAVKLNLPGMNSYYSTLSWVLKLRKDGSIAVDILIYIGDGSPLAITTTTREC